MNLQKPLLDLYIELKKQELNILNNFSQALRDFDKALNKATEMDKGFIIDMFYEKLVQIKYILIELKTQEARSYHDKFFNKHLKLPNKTPKKVTLLFKQFIKGITYFEYQQNHVNDIPIYHRLYSCGDGTDLYRNNNMICLKNISRVEKNRRKKLIERCYIERLIYDALFKYDTSIGTNEHTQDEGHLFRLDLTRQDYETCFKNCKIDVEIEWNDGMPLKLVIIRSNKGKTTSREIYIKSYIFDGLQNKIFDSIVECHKEVAEKHYMKFQTFFKEMEWKPVKL